MNTWRTKHTRKKKQEKALVVIIQATTLLANQRQNTPPKIVPTPTNSTRSCTASQPIHSDSFCSIALTNINWAVVLQTRCMRQERANAHNKTSCRYCSIVGNPCTTAYACEDTGDITIWSLQGSWLESSIPRPKTDLLIV